MTDLISRQAAIDAIADYLSYTTYTSAISFLNTAALILAKVPSVQSEIIRCNSCRHDNNCAIQDIAQTGGKFFCGFAQQKGEEDGRSNQQTGSNRFAQGRGVSVRKRL